jgi:hypothetical protein
MSINTTIHGANNRENKFETGIGPFTDKVLSSIIDKVTGDDFKEILTDKIVDPITIIINKKIRPYLYIGIFLYLIVLVLLVFIIYLLIKKKKL